MNLPILRSEWFTIWLRLSRFKIVAELSKSPANVSTVRCFHILRDTLPERICRHGGGRRETEAMTTEFYFSTSAS